MFQWCGSFGTDADKARWQSLAACRLYMTTALAELASSEEQEHRAVCLHPWAQHAPMGSTAPRAPLRGEVLRATETGHEHLCVLVSEFSGFVVQQTTAQCFCRRLLRTVPGRESSAIGCV